MPIVAFSDHVDPLTNINVWGKSGWRFLLAIAMVYPIQPSMEDKLSMRNFLVDVAKVLPCRECGGHFRNAVNHTLLDESLANRGNLLQWMHGVQNDIRQRQNKPRVTYTDMIRQCLTGQQETALIHCSYQQATIVLSITVIVLVLYVLYRRG